MKLLNILILIALTFGMPLVYAQNNIKSLTVPPPPPPAATSSTTCSKANDIRNIDVIKVDDGCEVNYTKQFDPQDSSIKSIASSKKGTSHCKKIQERVKSNLVSAGYNCKNQALNP